MVEGAHKKVVSDLAKKHSATKAEILSQVQQHLSKGLEENRDWTEKALDDKVRVDEVQDALKKITDSFHGKLANLQESLSVAITTKYADNCQNIVQVKEHMAKFLTQLTKMNEEKNEMLEIMNTKVDYSKLKTFLDELKEDQTVISNEVKARPTKSEVTELILKGGTPDEIGADMQNIT